MTDTSPEAAYKAAIATTEAMETEAHAAVKTRGDASKERDGIYAAGKAAGMRRAAVCCANIAAAAAAQNLPTRAIGALLCQGTILALIPADVPATGGHDE